MGKTNRLSKRLDQKVGIENGNNNQTLIREQWIHSLAEVVIGELEVEILEKMKIARREKTKRQSKQQKKKTSVVATTRPMSNSSTNGKSLRRDIQWGT